MNENKLLSKSCKVNSRLFFLELSDLNFDWSIKLICKIIITSITSVLDGFVCFMPKKLHYKTTVSNVNRARMQTIYSSLIFLLSGFSFSDTEDS